MSATTFNAVTYANKLKEAGMSPRIADVQAEELVNLMNDSVATKNDINILRNETKTDINNLRTETKADIAQLRNDMKIMELEIKGFLIKSLIMLGGSVITFQGIIGYITK